jgi:hypothetical protein
MIQFPVLIERLEKDFGQPVVENECPQPEAEDHLLHNVLWNLRGREEFNCELKVLESGNHRPLCFAFGGGRLP